MKFDPNNFYHIYNRGNNSQPIFFERDNYLFFLSKIRKHLSPLVEIIAYCLMPNHFHLLIYTPHTKTRSANNNHAEYSHYEYAHINKNIGIILSSYTRAINERYSKTGSLFQAHTKAKNVGKQDQQAFICFHYIHQNPLKAKLVTRLEDWEFSSYQDYVGSRDGTLCHKQLAYELLDIPVKSISFKNQSASVMISTKEKTSILS